MRQSRTCQRIPKHTRGYSRGRTRRVFALLFIPPASGVGATLESGVKLSLAEKRLVSTEPPTQVCNMAQKNYDSVNLLAE